MADVTSSKSVVQETATVDERSDFLRYIQDHPEASEQMMDILSQLYNHPMKVSQIQPYL